MEMGQWKTHVFIEMEIGGSNCQVASQEKGGGEDGRGECQVNIYRNEKE